MIFSSKNERGEKGWELVQSGKKQVTSRVNPVEVGKSIAIQPGRGKKAVGRRTVVSCMKRLEHYHQHQQNFTKDGDIAAWKQKEAELEGFLSWDGMMRYFQEHRHYYQKKHRPSFMDLYRIEFNYCHSLDGVTTNG